MVRLDGNKILTYLNKNEFLSSTYRNWYYSLIKDYLKINEKGVKKDNCLLSSIHPHFILSKKEGGNRQNLNKNFKLIFSPVVNSDININTIISNSKGLLKYFKKIKSLDFDDFFCSLPPITTCNLFLGKGSSPKLLFVEKNNNFVIVRVFFDNYLENYLLMKDILNKNSEKLEFDVFVIEEVGFIKTEKNCYFISKFMGKDLETEVIEYRKDLREIIFRLCVSLEKIFKKEKVFFRNLAPRNIIKGTSDKFYLIDFDYLLKINAQNEDRVREMALFKKVWFNDILDRKQISCLVSYFPCYKEEDAVLLADSFAQGFFQKSKISIRERKFLFRLTDLFERYDSCEGFDVYGHQLGRFISDFWQESSEIMLLKFIHRNQFKIKKLRAVLYCISRLDQELMFRHRYGFNKNLEPLSEKYFLKICEGGKIIKPDKIWKIIESLNFKSKYKLVEKIIGIGI